MSLKSWPEWLRYTLTGLFGLGAGLVTIALAFGDVRRDATDAKAAVAAHEPRIISLELQKAGDKEWRNALDARLGRMEAMLEKALDRPR